MLKFECGHYEFRDTYTHAQKFIVNKTKCKCWQCWRENNAKVLKELSDAIKSSDKDAFDKTIRDIRA